jgi:hypothetical protein
MAGDETAALKRDGRAHKRRAPLSAAGAYDDLALLRNGFTAVR